MKRGWKYLRSGECPDCSDSRVRLYAPVLSGEAISSYDLVNGEHIPHFDPVCKSCCKGYLIEDICSQHNLPKRAQDMCKLCQPKPSNRWSWSR